MTPTTTRRLATLAVASAISFTGLTSAPALAGTMQTAGHDFIHRNEGASTPEARSVGEIIGGYGAGKGTSGVVRGSGVLVGGRYVVTAAHLVDDLTGGSFKFNGQTYGINRLVVANNFYQLDTTGDNPTLNPVSRLYGGGSDIALIELDRRVAGARNLKATLNKSRKEAGRTATIVGFGTPGTGATGISTDPITDTDGALNNADGAVWDYLPTKRAGKNIIEPTGPFASTPIARSLVVDFDPDPSQLSSLAAAGLNPPSLDPFTGEYDLDEDDIPITGEFMPSVGDSGGGMFINGRLAGITSWTTRANSEFFSQAHFTRMSVGWWKWVENNIAAFNRLRKDPSLVPWVSENNATPGAGFKGVLRIRRGEPFDDNAGNGLPENAGTRNVINIFGPNLFIGFEGEELDVDQNLGPNNFIYNDPFNSDPAPLSQYFPDASSVPEPASLALLSLGGFVALRRTRH